MRFKDLSYWTFTTQSAPLAVKCPKCQALGYVKVMPESAVFVCSHCAHHLSKERVGYSFDVHGHCSCCERYFRVDIADQERQHFKVLKVACPHCGTLNSGQVHKMAHSYVYSGAIIQGHDPFLGLELYFLASFNGNLVWALNREHLAYLISYISATIRESDPIPCRSQADHLPTFMKTAKHRAAILKILYKLQDK